jgi:hypothetical protein
MSENERWNQIRKQMKEKMEMASDPDPMADLRIMFEQELARADRHWVPATDRDALRSKFTEAGSDRVVAEGVIAELGSLIEAAIRREQQQMAASGLTPAHVVAKMEATGAHRLRLGEGGAIECVGGMPPDGRLVLALLHFADHVRAMLIERERVVTLVAGS